MKFNFKQKDKKASKNTDTLNVLTDEIRAIREKNKEFQATNEHETYVIVCFSCKKDKEEFVHSIGMSEHTMIDGYKLANAVGKHPTKPSFKINAPLSKK